MWQERWNALDPRVRQALGVAGGVEAGLRIAALIELARLPAGAVRGSRPAWAAALLLVNSFGVLPLLFLLRGRR
ncbi:hypothetical protein [uncultured Amnibacterium sp.]|uniref:hypothetical protein n=1 Tax=uncultured Amnibacterium sp. TaxID=1631851 RepID=UPI0035CB864C